MKKMKGKEFKPGFRLSIFDVAFIAFGCSAAWFVYDVANEFSYVILFVISHFFYFCNIFRMPRVPELIWAACFVTLYWGVVLEAWDVKTVFLISILVTFIFSVIEVRKPSYHGVLWSRLNPNLETWFHKQG